MGWLTRVIDRRAVQKVLQQVFGHLTNTGVSPRHHTSTLGDNTHWQPTPVTPPREGKGTGARGTQEEGQRPTAGGQLGFRGAKESSRTKAAVEDRKKAHARERKAAARCTTGALGPWARPGGTGAVQGKGLG